MWSRFVKNYTTIFFMFEENPIHPILRDLCEVIYKQKENFVITYCRLPGY